MKRLLIICLLALFIVPAAASAVIPKPDPPITVSHENGPARSAPVARIIATSDGGGGNSTLAVVLAASALGIALGGAGYVAFRVRPMLHSS